MKELDKIRSKDCAALNYYGYGSICDLKTILCKKCNSSVRATVCDNCRKWGTDEKIRLIIKKTLEEK